MAPTNRALDRPRLLLVDGHAYAYRAFYAIRSLNSPSGQPTNAIYGFVKMLAKMRETLEPSCIGVIWDGGLAESRQQLLPEYKAHRPPMPDSLGDQIEQIKLYLAGVGIRFYCDEGVEADDWIATLAARAEAAQLDVVIASSDKDFMQLVTSRVGLLNPNDKAEVIWTSEEVRGKTGVAPEQIVDWLSLIGDSVDNIPGVPGVGPKTATQLLQQFNTIEQIYSRISEIPSNRLRDNLANAHSIVARNQQLIRLDRNVGRETRLEDFELRSESPEVLNTLFNHWGFKRLAAEYVGRANQQGVLL